jgi:hypothetical protein
MVLTGRAEDSKLARGLGLLDATTIVVGSMIGSGIFIVSAETSRLSRLTSAAPDGGRNAQIGNGDEGAAAG